MHQTCHTAKNPQSKQPTSRLTDQRSHKHEEILTS